jgi:hypothetical protein
MIPKKPAPDLIQGEDRFSGKFVLKTRIQRTRRSTGRGARHAFLQPPVAPARVGGRRGAAKAVYHCCTAVEMPDNGYALSHCIIADPATASVRAQSLPSKSLKVG